MARRDDRVFAPAVPGMPAPAGGDPLAKPDRLRSNHRGRDWREAKDLVRELRQRVEAAGFSGADAKSLFKAVHGRGYTLGVAPEKITVEE
jgi:hypothetical protein